jgi:PAS domain S-box-containing protein
MAHAAGAADSSYVTAALITFSVGMQLIAALLALRRARMGRRVGWILLLLAISFLIAFSVVFVVTGRDEPLLGMILLAVSGLLLAGMATFAANRAGDASTLRSDDAQAESRFAALMKSNVVGIAICNRSGSIQAINDELLRMLGVERQDIFNRHLTWRDLIPLAHHGAIESALAAPATPKSTRSFEADLNPSGQKHISVRISVMPTDHVTAESAIVFLDLTDFKAAAKSFMERERHFGALIDNSSDGHALLDHAGRVIFASPATRRILGHDLDDFTGQILFDFVEPGQRAAVESQLAKLVRIPGAEYTTQLRMRHVDGSYRTLETTFKNMRSDSSVRAIVMNYHDITAHQRAEDELRASNRMQQLLLRELNHRVRNNLAGLISLIDMSARSASDIPSLANTISSRVHSMAAVHGMLSHTSWSTVPLEEMIYKLLPHGRRGKVDVAGPPVQVPAHQCTPLGMVIGELMANSLKYGALSYADGRVQIYWQVLDADRDDVTELEFTWTESGGPAINEPPKPGLGTSLITGFVRSDLRGEAQLDYPSDGARHRLLVRLDQAQHPVEISK